MISSAQILNWLTIGFEQPTGSLTESFYFDKQNNEFFSVMGIDYFMLDDSMNFAGNVTTNYSEAQQNSLVDRMKRIEENDPDIIPIPRITLKDRQNLMRQFVDTLSDQKLIDILNQRIQNQDYRTKFDFYFGNEANELIKLKWEKLKSDFLHQKAYAFLNHNNINIDNTTLWIVDSEGSISLDLTEDKNTNSLPIDNPRQSKNNSRCFDS